MSKPDWITALDNACKKRTQESIATQIGYSTAVVNLVLKNKYPGNLAKVETAVRAKLMDATVECPAWPDEPLPLEQCQEYQLVQPPFNSPLKLRMYHACEHCPKNKAKR